MKHDHLSGADLISPPSTVFVAGHRGLVGAGVARRLRGSGFTVLTAERGTLDLRDSSHTRRHLQPLKPDAIVVAAAKVGGIIANENYPVDFLEENLQIQLSLISAAHAIDCRRLLFLGSSCIYPRQTSQPIAETQLMSGSLERTNEAYAIAKIAGIAQVKAYRRQYGRSFTAAMPTNLYGPGDNFNPETSHVIPALISRFHYAKVEGARHVHLLGSGTALREFLHVDDLSAACELILRRYDDSEIINVGSGEEVTIAALARMIAAVVGYEGQFSFTGKGADGTPRKLLDSSRLLELGWRPTIQLRDGLRQVYSSWVAAGCPARGISASCADRRNR